MAAVMASSVSSSSSSSFFLSAPTSPEKCLLNALLLYSHAPETDPPTPVGGGEEIGSDLKGFEFETSQRFCYVKDEGELRGGGGGGGPAMAFADELFSCGKVLPLKPPPKMGTDKSSVSAWPSPRMPRGRPLSWRSRWNDDFDPFEAALASVRKEGCHKRRARSLSPFRGSKLLDERPARANLGSSPAGRPGPDEKAVAVWSLKKMAQPRGMEFARRVRLVGSKNAESSGEPKRRQGVKELMLPEKKREPATGKSEEKIEIKISGRCNGRKRRLSKMVKMMAIVQYRPRSARSPLEPMEASDKFRPHRRRS